MAFFSKPKYSKVKVKAREGVPKGVWTKCPETGDMVFAKELKKNLMVVPSSGYHFPLSVPDRIESLLDKNTFVEQDSDLRPRLTHLNLRVWRPMRINWNRTARKPSWKTQ